MRKRDNQRQFLAQKALVRPIYNSPFLLANYFLFAYKNLPASKNNALLAYLVLPIVLYPPSANFLKNAKAYMEILSQNPICKVSIKRKDEDDRAYEELTLCQALSLFDVKYKMQVTKRYKGLGEMGSDVLFLSVVNQGKTGTDIN